MTNLSRLAGMLSCAAILAASGVSASAGVVRFAPMPIHNQPLEGVKSLGNGWLNDNGVIYHTPHYMATRHNVRHVGPDAGALSYHGGPVLLSPKLYVILWGYKSAGDPDKVGKLLKKYLKVIGGSALENVATQYYQSGSQFITNPPNQLVKIWKDNTNSIPAHPTDSQVAAEAAASLSVFGYDPNGSYVVATAHNHSSSGFGTSYCAYHGATNTSKGPISYTNLPYQPDAGQSCGANIISPPSDESGTDEGVSIVEGHEFMESITDPQLSAWWDSGNGEEIGDLCAWTNIANDPMGSGSYTMQPEWSNATNTCVHSYP